MITLKTHSVLLAAALPSMLLALAACSNDEPMPTPQSQTDDQEAIAFTLHDSPLSRADAALQTEAVNFGVFAYKGSSATAVSASDQTVMDNYLVGYGQSATQSTGTVAGYNPSGATTIGDASSTADGQSYWFYENLGSSQYTNTDSQYILATNTAMMSNNAEQYLKYWDDDYAYTYFYAYAPYVNGSNTPTFDPATQTLTYKADVEMGTNRSGYSQQYMYAASIVPKTQYGQDVDLVFHRLNAKVRIGFYETIPGYKVYLTPVLEWDKVNKKMTTNPFNTEGEIVAVPAKWDGNSYDKDTYVYQSTPTIDLSDVSNPTVSWGSQNLNNNEWIFDNVATSTVTIATETLTEPWIGEDAAANAVYSPTYYYPLPAGTIENCGFIYYVSFMLVAEDTGETIQVNNAGVYVEPTYTQWESNMLYTYIFKITAAAPAGGDPDAPTIGTDVLKAIVFDACTVTDFATGATQEFEVGSTTTE
ncbi:MAG: hypothetical protein LIO90_04650 [Bacteroidales bacterium]|nr:hypothetical protein [Bacteroidales bacterium]